MANNLRYLLEHFCLDGQKIDVSSQLDEENADNIAKINTQTIPNINTRIDDIKNTDIPNINSRIDSIKKTDIPSINQKINTINNTTIPNVQASVTAIDGKADRINESVAKNTRNIGTLSDNVTMQGNAINSIETEKIPSVENNINDLSTKVDTNTDSINGLTTKVNANTDSINTINNTSIPHLQSEIDNLSGGGTGSVGELRKKVEKNTNDINTLNGKVKTNTTAISTINGLTTKVNANTDSINTINNTSIPHLQEEIDNLSGGGSGSVGELREKVEKNTSDISALSGKVETNTTSISTINDTSIPNLQSEVDSIKNTLNCKWKQVLNNHRTSKGFIVDMWVNEKIRLAEIHAKFNGPQTVSGGDTITDIIPNIGVYTPFKTISAPVKIELDYIDGLYGTLTVYQGQEIKLGFTLSSFEFTASFSGSVFYHY